MGSGEQWMFSSMERCFILHIKGGGSRWRGALVIRRLMCEDGLAQEGDTVWRRRHLDRARWMPQYSSEDELMVVGGGDL